ncbi:MAG: 3-deoxy-7-phosphoheptulonate synthase [Planctomycetes bacterium]|nr:3-deoxy-7-phosphoheptulonate synthase [Planctomycetota bacterium]
MLLRLRPATTDADREVLRRVARERGYEVSLLGRDGRVIELVRRSGVPHPGDRVAFEDLSFVAGVLEAADAPELSERAPGREDTILRVGEAAFGGPFISLIAGPCAVEDGPRLLEIARAVRAAGATLLRGGAFKPRSSPYAFQGLGQAGLELLAEARAATDLGIVTEVLDPRDVEAVAKVADVLQIGARSMANYALLAEAAQSGKALLLKRGMMATAREFLLAAEHVLAQGNERVLLCERGVRGFDRATRNVLDVGTVAHLKRATHLPVIVDPSHAAGRAELVLPLSKAGLAAGADGLMIEVHPQPNEARSDAAQAVSTAVFAEIAVAAAALARLDRRHLVTCKDVCEPVASAGEGVRA